MESIQSGENANTIIKDNFQKNDENEKDIKDTLSMNEKEILKISYEKKYCHKNPEKSSSLVAPQTSGKKILRLLGFSYKQFTNKNVTDIGGGVSSLAFELAPRAKKIIIIDPIYAYNFKQKIEEELEFAKKRFDNIIGNKAQYQDFEEKIYESQEVINGIQKRQQYEAGKMKDIQNFELNTSFAQKIKGIQENSQDFVFMNFVLDKLGGDDIPKKEKEEHIFYALTNAYHITKSGGIICGLHDKGKWNNEIINALCRGEYQWEGDYKETYLYFIIKKE